MPTPEIQLYNTLTHQMETFQPVAEPAPDGTRPVYMYNCGPTVYDFAHIGNFRAFVFADVVRRFLELAGYQVHQVMNITDVGHMTEDQLADGGGEDKMAVAAQRMKESKKQGKPLPGEVDNPDDPRQVAAYYARAFLEDASALGIKVASEPGHLPRATDHIGDMLGMVQKLVDAGSAYVAEDGAVYFSVESFPDYGKLSGNTLDKLRGGAGGRVRDTHQSAKRHPADFLLWKPDDSHVMKWDSPFGVGYPGWHIECSAMATAVLGREVIDIHTGGEDNIFPHHECEIAQTRSATGRDSFANYWLHTRFLMVEGKKMSKSKGNFFTVRDLLAKGIDPVVIRFELMKAHYRSNMNFTMKGLEDSASAVRKLRDAADRWARGAGDRAPASPVDRDHPVVAKFIAALADDLNVAGALAVAFEFIAGDHPEPAESLAVLRAMDSVLGVLPPESPESPEGDEAGGDKGADEEAQAMAAQLDEARKNKDFDTADAVRGKLQAMGYEVKTTAEGTVVQKKLA